MGALVGKRGEGLTQRAGTGPPLAHKMKAQPVQRKRLPQTPLNPGGGRAVQKAR